MEFYQKDDYIDNLANKTMSSLGRLKTEHLQEDPVLAVNKTNLNAKDRKLLELNPKLATEGNINQSNTDKKLTFYDSNSTAVKYSSKKSTKDNRTDSLRSNIFNQEVFSILNLVEN